jgi:hypothetical protein
VAAQDDARDRAVPRARAEDDERRAVALAVSHDLRRDAAAVAVAGACAAKENDLGQGRSIQANGGVELKGVRWS